MERYLLDELFRYTKSDNYPLHMPGHKRQIQPFTDPYSIDITEIDGFDNLHHPEGILLEAQQRAADLFGAKQTYFLVNGSTCGILSAVAAASRPGGEILIARNCHKSACHAAILSRQDVAWLYPPMDEKRGIFGSVSPVQVEESLKEEGSKVSAVLITSPTYDGVVSDIREIAKIVHQAGAILIVDEAHGAHFSMHSCFPESAISCGADLVVHSLHKTMPSLTQTALLHVNAERVDTEKLRRSLERFQSSSPSYVLMAAIDECIRLMEEKGPQMYQEFAGRLEELRKQLGKMKILHLVTGKEPQLCAFDYDPSRIVISSERSALSGKELADLLRRTYHLEPEMASMRTLTAILTPADSPEGIERLQKALLEIDREQLDKTQRTNEKLSSIKMPRPLTKMPMWEAEERSSESILLGESCDRISAEFIYLYPPGNPLIVPGEQIPGDLPELIGQYRAAGFTVQGLSDYSGEKIRCVVPVKE